MTRTVCVNGEYDINVLPSVLQNGLDFYIGIIVNTISNGSSFVIVWCLLQIFSILTFVS